MAFPATAPPGPPDICGFAPLRAPLNDIRWNKVRAEPGPQLRYRDAGISHKVDAWVNFNIRYVRDVGDVWQTPLETFGKKTGDCEDLALLKRAILLRSGAPEGCVYLVLAQDLIAREAHAFLVCFEVGWTVLDSRNNLTMPVDNLRDYAPILAFSGAQAWIFGRRR